MSGSSTSSAGTPDRFDDFVVARLSGEAAPVPELSPSQQAEADTVTPDLDRIRGGLADAAVWADLPPVDRVVDAVGRAVAEEAEPSTASAGSVPSPATDAIGPASSRRRPAWLWSTVGAAAAAAVAVVVLVVAGQTPPPAVTVELAGTELAPDVAARAEVWPGDGGWRIEMVAPELPPAPEGRFYHAWFVGPEGPVSLGTFNSGEGVIVLWSGVDMEGEAALAVTIENDDGEPKASIDQMVLLGDYTLER